MNTIFSIFNICIQKHYMKYFIYYLCTIRRLLSVSSRALPIIIRSIFLQPVATSTKPAITGTGPQNPILPSIAPEW